MDENRVTVLMVDDQPAKLLSYEAILAPLGETLVRASSAEEAMGILLRSTVAVMLVDVCMPGMDGFDLTELVRKHPRFRDTAILLVSGVQMGELDRLRGYESGAVDYIPVPIVPELLRAKVRVFVDLFRKSRRLVELTRGLELQVEERTRELQRSNEELQQFAYVASHDLQEPLRMVSSFVQLLGDRYAEVLDTQGQEFVRFAVEGVQRMHQLIDDLLHYARVDRSELGQGIADCEKALDAALGNLRLAVEESGAEVLHGPLPRVRGDEVQIAQLLQNLVGNSLKFARPGVPPRVRVDAEPRGRDWLFSVRDNGIGVPPSQSERIFELFQRLHAREEYSGTGIGLAVCRKLVHRHRGRIWLDPDSPEGCTIRFTLPVSLSSDPAPPAPPEHEPDDDVDLAPLAGASSN
jgi:two-component system sensor histidine kinase/response regulator